MAHRRHPRRAQAADPQGPASVRHPGVAVRPGLRHGAAPGETTAGGLFVLGGLGLGGREEEKNRRRACLSRVRGLSKVESLRDRANTNTNTNTTHFFLQGNILPNEALDLTRSIQGILRFQSILPKAERTSVRACLIKSFVLVL